MMKKKRWRGSPGPEHRIDRIYQNTQTELIRSETKDPLCKVLNTPIDLFQELLCMGYNLVWFWTEEEFYDLSEIRIFQYVTKLPHETNS